jgi:hypothetical protein
MPSGPNLLTEGASICTSTELQRLELFFVLVELAVGVNLNLDPTVGAFLGKLHQFQGRLALGRVWGNDVAELDDDRFVCAGGNGRQAGG